MFGHETPLVSVALPIVQLGGISLAILVVGLGLIRPGSGLPS